MKETSQTCEIKICGLTDPDEALACAEMKIQAIGLVFFPKSRRCVSTGQALRICRALPETVQTIGVFVNETADAMLEVAEKSGLTGIQLHGQEPPKVARKLKSNGLTVIKALYLEGEPSIAAAESYGADAYLLECAQGFLPGGNAMAWNWQAAAGFGERHPFLLAGGLKPENVVTAIESAKPHGVDVSSGVEAAPGRKDIKKTMAFVSAVEQYKCQHALRRIFNAGGE
ncbi:MAG: phosphoribosylanthranilate isomerase [Desulfobacterales bacterium]|nr:phosphoribosylanthranilate isomerase [Desulfobacterales bacterium]